MNKESIEFMAPEGMELPEGLNPGDVFEAMATVQLGEDGQLSLKELDGMPIMAQAKEMEEEEMEGEEGENEVEDEGEEMDAEEETMPEGGMSEGGFLDAIERRAAARK